MAFALCAFDPFSFTIRFFNRCPTPTSLNNKNKPSYFCPLLCLIFSGSNPLTPDLLSPDDTSMTFSLAPFETATYQPASTAAASFVISDVTEEEEVEEEDEDEKDVVSMVSELVPDPLPPVSMTASATFDLDRPSMDYREAEEDTVSLSKSTSFADVMDILKDMNRMKMSKDRCSMGYKQPRYRSDILLWFYLYLSVLICFLGTFLRGIK